MKGAWRAFLIKRTDEMAKASNKERLYDEQQRQSHFAITSDITKTYARHPWGTVQILQSLSDIDD
jgi:hypothetical protein